MIRAEYDYYLPAPPAPVFAYISNPANDQEWQSSCVASVLRGERPDSGCPYSITFSFLGRRMSFESEIDEFEPDIRFGFRVKEGPFYYDGHYRFESEGEGTRVYWQFNADPKGFFGIIPATILRKVLISQVEKDAVTLSKLFAGRPQPAHAQ